jgi:hypothetical protein
VHLSEHTPRRGRGNEEVHWLSSRSEQARFWLWSFVCTSARMRLSFTSPRLSSLDLSHKALQLHYHDTVNTDRCFCAISSSNPFLSSSSLPAQLTREHRDGHPELTARRRRDHARYASACPWSLSVPRDHYHRQPQGSDETQLCLCYQETCRVQGKRAPCRKGTRTTLTD